MKYEISMEFLKRLKQALDMPGKSFSPSFSNLYPYIGGMQYLKQSTLHKNEFRLNENRLDAKNQFELLFIEKEDKQLTRAQLQHPNAHQQLTNQVLGAPKCRRLTPQRSMSSTCQEKVARHIPKQRYGMFTPKERVQFVQYNVDT